MARLLAVVSATLALVVWIVDARGASQPPTPAEWVSTSLPFSLVDRP